MDVKDKKRIGLFIAIFLIFTIIRFLYSLDLENTGFIKLRLFRIVALSLCGGGISLSGFVLQKVFRNPIVDIYVLGNASVCVLAQIISISLFYYPTSYYVSYLLSFLLTIILMFLVYRFSYSNGYFDLVKLLLLSFAINIFVWGIINFAIYNVTRLSSINIYQLLEGTMEGIYVKEVLVQLLGCGLSFICLYILLDRILILSVGEEFAITTGINVTKLKFLIYILISILSTIITQTIGIVPFIGIIIPHFIGLLIKSNIYTQFFAILLTGSTILIISDLISVIISFYFNLPVFIILNFFAFPFFVYMVFKK